MIFKKLTLLYTALPLHLQRSLRYLAGWLCIAFGIVGLLLPILPGIPFLLLGGWLLGWSSWMRPWLAKWYPIDRLAALRSHGLRGGS